MTGIPRRPHRPDHWSSAHERARSRAAERLDTQLDPAESHWLDEHLATCPDCRAVAAAYETDRLALRALRDVPVDPPRDLWARTAAAIEAESARRGRAIGRRRGAQPASRTGGSRFPLGAFAGVMVMIVVVGAAALSGGWFDGPPVAPAGSPAIAITSPAPDATDLEPPATPMAVAAGDVTWVHSLSDGAYAVNVSSVDHVCPVGGGPNCAALEEGAPERISLAANPRTIIGSPTDAQAVVVGSDGAGSDKVFVMSLPETPKHSTEPSTAPDTSATPSAPASQPPASVSPTPVSRPPASVSPTPNGETQQPTDPPGSPEPSPETGSPEPSVSATPEATPGETATPSPSSTTPSPTPSPSSTSQPSASPQATASAMAIASGVTVVGQSAAFSNDGRWFAFTARPANGSAGPDIWVWRLGDDKARRLTSDGRSVFASWDGDTVVASMIATEASQNGEHAGSSVPLDPSSGAASGEPVALWRPVVDPTDRFAIGWVGTVATDDAGTIQAPGTGQLVITSWQAGGDAVATRSLVPGGDAPMADFDVRWDETGDWVAVWTADPSDPGLGRLSLYRLDRASGALVRAKGAPRDVPALPGFSIGDGRLAWVTPDGQDAEGSKVQVVAWSGDGVGAVESVPADDVLVVR